MSFGKMSFGKVSVGKMSAGTLPIAFFLGSAVFHLESPWKKGDSEKKFAPFFQTFLSSFSIFANPRTGSLEDDFCKKKRFCIF